MTHFSPTFLSLPLVLQSAFHPLFFAFSTFSPLSFLLDNPAPHLSTHIDIYIYIYTPTSNGKKKNEQLWWESQ
jgi:hypothetical protein